MSYSTWIYVPFLKQKQNLRMNIEKGKILTLQITYHMQFLRSWRKCFKVSRGSVNGSMRSRSGKIICMEKVALRAWISCIKLCYAWWLSTWKKLVQLWTVWNEKCNVSKQRIFMVFVIVFALWFIWWVRIKTKFCNWKKICQKKLLGCNQIHIQITGPCEIENLQKH